MRGESIVPFLVAILTVTAALLITSPFSSLGTSGRSVFNLDPSFQAANNDLVWDPNTEPGFGATPGLHLNWTDPIGGPGTVDYYVGPWANGSIAPAPHFGVGPQAFNFAEVPRTQLYRNPSWGDYQNVDQGFSACAVNQGDLTVTAVQAPNPVYVGMPERGVDWQVVFTVDWTPADATPGLSDSARLALTTTTTLPPLPGQIGARLVYSQVVLWSSAPIVESITAAPPGTEQGSVGLGVFPWDQLPSSYVQRTYSIDLSPIMATTLAGLDLAGQNALLSYVYLEADGYNVHLHFDVRDMYLSGPSDLCGSSLVASLNPNSPTAGGTLTGPRGHDPVAEVRRYPGGTPRRWTIATTAAATTAAIAAETSHEGTGTRLPVPSGEM